MDSTNNNSPKPSPDRQLDNGQTQLIQNKSPPEAIKKRVTIKDPSSALPPPDGGWGWMVVLACFIACAGVVGLTRAFGIIYVEIKTAFPDSSDLALSWVPGLYNTLSTGFGCGAGLCTTPGIMMVAKYFKKRRSLANGLCLAGTSSGAFVQPLIVEWLANKYGFRGAMLIMGGFILHISAFALVYRPLEKPVRKPKNIPQTSRRYSSVKRYFSFITCWFSKNPYKQPSPHENTPESKIMLKETSPFPNAIEMIPANGSATPSSSPERDSDREESPIDSDEVKEMYRRQSTCLHHSVNDLSTLAAIEQHPKKKGPTGLKKYLDYTIFWNRAYILFWISSFCTSIGYPHASVFMPAYAETNLGIDKTKIGFFLSITAGADLIGRIGIGYLADLNLFKKTHAYIIAVTTTATATLALPFMVDFKDLAIHSAFYGLGVGSFFMLTPVILTDHHGTEKVASSYGLVRLSHGLASLICAPIAGSLRDITGTYVPGFIFMGLSMLCGALVCFAIPRALVYERKKEALRRGSTMSGVVDYQPVGNGSNYIAPADERRASHSSLSSWGRRYSVDPDV
uniref:Major facilitator superfamily (MFS) profile domain-containing protein n=1 Tax=Strigamia maritima TaxID=126957 RepID=T1JCF6_STRMM